MSNKIISGVLLLSSSIAIISNAIGKSETTIEYRVMELERKVAGMQKQITLLHTHIRK